MTCELIGKLFLLFGSCSVVLTNDADWRRASARLLRNRAVEVNTDGEHMLLQPAAVFGPLASGKDEIDGLPLLNSSLHEHNAKVEWRLFDGTKNGIDIAYDDVDWSSLLRAIGTEVLEWQAFAVMSFNLATAASIQLQCAGVWSYSVDDGPPLAGDGYGRQHEGLGVLKLAAGLHVVSARLRARYAGRLYCSVSHYSEDFVIAGPILAAPDWIENEGLAGAYVAVALSNISPDKWLKNLRINAPLGWQVSLLDSAIRLAPGQRAAVGLKLLCVNSSSKSTCIRSLDLDLTFGSGLKVIPLKLRFTCRANAQSVLSTYLDEDGSVRSAAVVAPPKSKAPAPFWEREAKFILLVLPGTSVSARDAADSMKHKPNANDAEYTFGVSNAYVLAPSRHGAHNWEGPGLRTAAFALDALFGKQRARLPRVILGHSQGGHGALLLATSFLENLIGVAAVAPWSSKTKYGDANTRFKLDSRVESVDPALVAILDASIAEHDVDSHLSNSCGLKHWMIRVGTNDQVVHPFYARRTSRLAATICQESVERIHREIPDKEHWWWDTHNANDGGCVNDPEMRAFFAKTLTSGDVHQCVQGQQLVVSNPATIIGPNSCGYRVLQQKVPFVRRSVVTHLTDFNNSISIKTRNVRRLRIHSMRPSTRHLIIDDDTVSIKAERTATISLCHDDRWQVCRDSDEVNERRERSPRSHGPLRIAFERPFLIVVPRQHLPLALYIANLFYLTAEGWARIVLDEDDPDGYAFKAAQRHGMNLIFVGTGLNWFSRIPQVKTDFSVTNTIRIGECEWLDERFAVAALIPLLDGPLDQPPRLGLVLSGNSDYALEKLIATLATPTIPPMARQPFSGSLPDVIILDANATLTYGVAGFELAGYWNSEWRLSPLASWQATCRGHSLRGRTRYQREHEEPSSPFSSTPSSCPNDDAVSSESCR